VKDVLVLNPQSVRPTAYALLLVLSLATSAWADFKAGMGASTNNAANFSGPVIRFLEGDTLEVLHNHRPERIRLNGIDCPEQGQPYALLAKHLASDLVFRKEVTLQTHGLDEYGNTIGDLVLPDGMNLNQELVRKGLCWWSRSIGPGDMRLEGLEKEAREAKKGLWNDPQRVPPWEWRRRKE
jgi:micrococcal nuclease